MLPVQYPSTVGGSDLYNALDWVGWNQRNQQFQEAQQNIQVNRDAALQDTLFKAQEQPQRLRQLTLGNDTTEAQLPGVKARSAISKDEADQLALFRLKYPNSSVDLRANKENAETAAARFEARRQGIYSGMINPNPEISEEARKRYDMLPESVKFQLGLTSKEGIAQGNNASAERIAAMRANARKVALSVEEKITSGKMKKEEAQVLFANLAAFEEDPDKKAHWEALARYYETTIQKDKQAAGQAKPTVDVTGLTKGEVPTVGGGIPGTTQIPGAAERAQKEESAPVSQPDPKTLRAIQQRLVNSGKPFEPDKFWYRIDPTTNKIQAWPKG